MYALLSIIQILVQLRLFTARTKHQKAFALKLLEPLCAELTKNEKLRLHKYGLHVPLFIGESFCTLRGSKLIENERTAITCLGCMTGLFDDLFDEQNYSDSFIRNLVENPVKNQAHPPQITVLIDLYHLFLSNTPHKSNAKALMLRVFDAQVASRLQTKATLTPDEIETITYNKGGFTMQLYRRAFAGTVSETEDALFYQLGAIGQLENDLFDIYNDYSQGINTLATVSSNMAWLQTKYTSLRDSIFNLIEQTAFESRNKKQFKQLCALIIARGEVAITQLHRLAKKTNNQFCIEKYQRTELVCDMEKTKNRVNLLRYAAKCLKK